MTAAQIREPILLDRQTLPTLSQRWTRRTSARQSFEPRAVRRELAALYQRRACQDLAVDAEHWSERHASNRWRPFLLDDALGDGRQHRFEILC